MKFIQLCFLFGIMALFNITLINEAQTTEIDKKGKLNDLISTILAPEQSAASLAIEPVYAPIINKDIVLIEHRPQQINIKVSYPEISRPIIDEHIALWAKNLVDSFNDGIKDIDDDTVEYTLQAQYDISRPSQFVISIEYKIERYTGGAHGNMEVVSLNYNIKTGKLLSLENLFGDLSQALNLMSEFSRKELPSKLGEYLDENMLESGTAPTIENYSTLSLKPKGIIIHFQPYQIAPYVAGQKNIFMTLPMLEKAKPNPAVWDNNIED